MMNIYADRNEVKIRVKYIDIVNGLYLYIYLIFGWMKHISII